MPNIQSAKKKLRKDAKRKKQNLSYVLKIQNAISSLIKGKSIGTSAKQVQKTISLIDKGAKRKVIHKNKASRLKSRVMKLSSRKA